MKTVLTVLTELAVYHQRKNVLKMTCNVVNGLIAFDLIH